MYMNSKAVSVAELQNRLGAEQTSAGAGRHRAQARRSVSRTTAHVMAGAAIAGGAAMAGAPLASAQSVDPAQAQDIFDQVNQGLADNLGIQIDPNVAQQYADIPGIDFGSLGNAIPGGAAHAPTVGRITSGFGPRWGTFHNGTDFGAPIGTPMYAAKSGVVEAAGPASGYGLWIRIRTDDGYLLEYGHNDQNYVSVGQRVQAGQVIGTVGNRGYSTGPHLHFGVQDPQGRWIDPVPWLAGNGVIV